MMMDMGMYGTYAKPDTYHANYNLSTHGAGLIGVEHGSSSPELGHAPINSVAHYYPQTAVAPYSSATTSSPSSTSAEIVYLQQGATGAESSAADSSTTPPAALQAFYSPSGAHLHEDTTPIISSENGLSYTNLDYANSTTNYVSGLPAVQQTGLHHNHHHHHHHHHHPHVQHANSSHGSGMGYQHIQHAGSANTASYCREDNLHSPGVLPIAISSSAAIHQSSQQQQHLGQVSQQSGSHSLVQEHEHLHSQHQSSQTQQHMRHQHPLHSHGHSQHRQGPETPDYQTGSGVVPSGASLASSNYLHQHHLATSNAEDSALHYPAGPAMRLADVYPHGHPTAHYKDLEGTEVPSYHAIQQSSGHSIHPTRTHSSQLPHHHSQNHQQYQSQQHGIAAPGAVLGTVQHQTNHHHLHQQQQQQQQQQMQQQQAQVPTYKWMQVKRNVPKPVGRVTSYLIFIEGSPTDNAEAPG